MSEPKAKRGAGVIRTTPAMSATTGRASEAKGAQEMREARVTTSDGVTLVADVVGTSGAPVLLLHGFPQSSYAWRNVSGPLAERGFRAIVPDMRGYGRSDKPRRVRDYKAARLVEDMAELVRGLGHQRVHVVGHDWGGVVAWMFAARHPELVDRLVILNGPHPLRMLKVLTTSGAQVRRSWYIFFFQLPFLAERFLKRSGTIARVLKGSARSKSVFSADDVAEYERSVRLPGAARGMIAYYRAALRYPEFKFPRIDRPTLVLWGLDDQALGPELADGLERYVSDLRVERFSGVSHWIVDEEPERVTETIARFLMPS